MFEGKVIEETLISLSRESQFDGHFNGQFIMRLVQRLTSEEELFSLDIPKHISSLTGLYFACVQMKDERGAQEVNRLIGAVVDRLSDNVKALQCLVGKSRDLMTRSSDKELNTKGEFFNSIANAVVHKGMKSESVAKEMAAIPVESATPEPQRPAEAPKPAAQPNPQQQQPEAKPVPKTIEQRVEEKEPQAMFEQGMKIRQKEGIRNRKQGFNLIRAAADAGYAPAQHQIGYFYFHGTDVEENLQEATRYFKLAADQGDPNGEYRYGYALYSGKGEKKDYTGAAEYMKRAADKGIVGAQYFYGYFCMRGLGVEKRYDIARTYLRMAAEKNDKRAKDALEDLKRRERAATGKK